jgi:hypothetical protein
MNDEMNSSVTESTEINNEEVNEAKAFLESKGLSKEELERLQEEADEKKFFEKSFALVQYQIRIGDVLNEVDGRGARTDLYPDRKEVTKEGVGKALGLSNKQISNYTKMASNK